MKTPLIQPAYQEAKYSVQPTPFKVRKIQGFTATTVSSAACLIKSLIFLTRLFCLNYILIVLLKRIALS
jgi:hypothetical protein